MLVKLVFSFAALLAVVVAENAVAISGAAAQEPGLDESVAKGDGNKKREKRCLGLCECPKGWKTFLTLFNQVQCQEVVQHGCPRHLQAPIQQEFTITTTVSSNVTTTTVTDTTTSTTTTTTTDTTTDTTTTTTTTTTTAAPTAKVVLQTISPSLTTITTDIPVPGLFLDITFNEVCVADHIFVRPYCHYPVCFNTFFAPFIANPEAVFAQALSFIRGTLSSITFPSDLPIDVADFDDIILSIKGLVGDDGSLKLAGYIATNDCKHECEKGFSSALEIVLAVVSRGTV